MEYAIRKEKKHRKNLSFLVLISLILLRIYYKQVEFEHHLLQKQFIVNLLIQSDAKNLRSIISILSLT